ncbi:MAG: hypothetical protein Q4B70_17320 [Lachnospiraceae bacterium]|nr:hypothetical protein [Lachnospiraceae bacterium]
MNLQERILALRLKEKLDQNPKFAKDIGAKVVVVKKRKGKEK